MTERDEEISSAVPNDLNGLPRLNGFRLRGVAMTRLEGFVDATFAFAITVLIIAGQEVPDDLGELLGAFRNVPAFAASIMVLGIFWKGHWLWSRRYGLEDNVSIWISWAMIFTMLIYVYPLKVVFNGMFAAFTDGALGARVHASSAAQARAVFVVYALGFTAMALQILLLNFRAWRLRKPLRLDGREQFLTRCAMGGWAIPTTLGLLSLGLALTASRENLAWSGWIYFSMLVLVPLHRRWVAKKVALIKR